MNLGFSSEAESCYISTSGYGEIIHDLERKDDLWPVATRPYFPDGSQFSNFGLLKFEPESAEYWGSTSKKMVCLFALGASILAADPMAIDEQDHLKNL